MRYDPGMRERARSSEDKLRRSEDLLDAAEALSRELGGVRLITVAAVTERAGLHRTGVRRYYANKEELFLELAERGWGQWRDAILSQLTGRTDLSPVDVADVIVDTIVELPVFCDLLTHVTLTLEGSVDIARARRYKTRAFAAHDAMVGALAKAGRMDHGQLQGLLAATIMLAAGFWQVSHPAPTLAQLYQEMPAWGHVALDFVPHLRSLLRATAIGLAAGADDTPA